MTADTDMKQIPIYRHTGAYAREHGELTQFRESNLANIACRSEIEQAIRRHFDGMHLDKRAITEVLDIFGPERTLYVLANTVQRKAWDGRFSTGNKAWAEQVTIPADEALGIDRRDSFVVSSHPAVLDGLITMARDAVRAMEQDQTKASVHERLHKPPVRSATARPVKSKEAER